MKIIDKLAYIRLENGKILSTRSKGKDKWYIPGGKREEGESDHIALIREIKEELSVDLKMETLKYIGVFQAQADSHPEGVLVKMTCYSGDYEGELMADSEIEELGWLNYADYDKISPVDQIIFDFLKKLDELT